MPKKFLVLTTVLLLLAGCGSSDIVADAIPASINIVQTSPDRIARAADSADQSVSGMYDAAPAAEDELMQTEKVEQQCDCEYFTFQRGNRSVENDENVTILVENRCDVSFFSEDPEGYKWVNGILSENRQNYDADSRNLIQYAEEVISEYGPESFYMFSNYEDRGIVRHDDRVVSMLSVSHIQSGGAHPSTIQSALNLDLQERKILKLEDVIYEDGAAELERMVVNTVKNKYDHLDIDALYEDYADMISVSMSYGEMTPYWYFGNGTLVVFYNQYELGPYSSGIIKVELPYEKLHGVLREEFFPEEPQDDAGDLTVVTDAQDRNRIPCVIEPDGQQILISADGTVRGVQVSEILWMDEMPVSQTMMISVNEMTDQNVLVLTGGFDDASRSFAVEFYDGSGNHRTYYIHPNGLTEKP